MSNRLKANPASSPGRLLDGNAVPATGR
jgi:hypothetical protein